MVVMLPLGGQLSRENMPSGLIICEPKMQYAANGSRVTSNPRSRITRNTRLRFTGQSFLPLQPPRHSPIAVRQFLSARHHDLLIVGSVRPAASRAAFGSTDSTG